MKATVLAASGDVRLLDVEEPTRGTEWQTGILVGYRSPTGFAGLIVEMA